MVIGEVKQHFSCGLWIKCAGLPWCFPHAASLKADNILSCCHQVVRNEYFRVWWLLKQQIKLCKALFLGWANKRMWESTNIQPNERILGMQGFTFSTIQFNDVTYCFQLRIATCLVDSFYLSCLKDTKATGVQELENKSFQEPINCLNVCTDFPIIHWTPKESATQTVRPKSN